MEDPSPKVTPPHERSDYWFKARDGLDIPVLRYLPRNPTGRAVIYVDGGPSGEISGDLECAGLQVFSVDTLAVAVSPVRGSSVIFTKL